MLRFFVIEHVVFYFLVERVPVDPEERRRPDLVALCPLEHDLEQGALDPLLDLAIDLAPVFVVRRPPGATLVPFAAPFRSLWSFPSLPVPSLFCFLFHVDAAP
mgnify:CR=1 FL=1